MPDPTGLDVTERLEAMEDLKASLGWKMLVANISQQLEQLRNSLAEVEPDKATVIAHRQGMIGSLRSLLAMPDDILHLCRAGLGEQKTSGR